jgi:outer membrane protein assembly factor BamB
MPDRCLTAAILVLLAATGGAAADWPQFRGPQASGVDASAPLPIEWNVATGQNILWQTTLPGLAHASPIVSGDRIYVATAVGPGDAQLKVGLYGDIEPVQESGAYQWRLLALARSSGQVLWNVVGHEAVPRVKRHPKSTHCNSTPPPMAATLWPFSVRKGCSASTLTGSCSGKRISGRWTPAFSRCRPPNGDLPAPP